MNKISIITICFNNLEEVIKTCESVDNQVTKPSEHLIINGSTDNSIENYFFNNTILYRKIFNEKDNGIADAFNKGINLSAGHIILMLNSGDCLYDKKIIALVSEKFEADKNLKWLHGKYKFKRNGIWVTLGKPFDKEKLYRGMRSISHQTMFVKKELYKKYGLYDSSYKIAMDFDFLVRIRNEPFLFLPEILAVFNPGGISIKQYDLSLRENTIIIEKYLGKSWKHKIWNARLKILYTIQNIPLAGKMLYRIKVLLGLANA